MGLANPYWKLLCHQIRWSYMPSPSAVTNMRIRDPSVILPYFSHTFYLFDYSEIIRQCEKMVLICTFLNVVPAFVTVHIPLSNSSAEQVTYQYDIQSMEWGYHQHQNSALHTNRLWDKFFTQLSKTLWYEQCVWYCVSGIVVLRKWYRTQRV
jgi:hypothetical protein